MKCKNKLKSNLISKIVSKQVFSWCFSTENKRLIWLNFHTFIIGYNADVNLYNTDSYSYNILLLSYYKFLNQAIFRLGLRLLSAFYDFKTDVINSQLLENALRYGVNYKSQC